jgi:hypothetical protein
VHRFLEGEMPKIIPRVLMNYQQFSPQTISYLLSILGFYIHAEPINIPVIIEMKFHEAVFEILNDIPENTKVIFSLIDLISAFSLNVELRNIIVERRILFRFLDILLGDKYLDLFEESDLSASFRVVF